MKVGSRDEVGYKFSKTGFFDNDILCVKCDSKLGELDDYAITFCRTFDDRREIIREPKTHNQMFLINSVDTDKLVRFTASVCWRHSISNRPEASNIALGPFEKEFEQVSFGDSSVLSEPALIIWANQSAINIKKLAFVPTMHRHEGLRFCSMILGGLSFVLKVDHRPLPAGGTRLLAINGKERIISAYKPFDGSFEEREMMNIVRNMSTPRTKPSKASPVI